MNDKQELLKIIENLQDKLDAADEAISAMKTIIRDIDTGDVTIDNNARGIITKAMNSFDKEVTLEIGTLIDDLTEFSDSL